MPTVPAENQIVDQAYRDRCYSCFRPKEHCFCAAIPAIDNQTEVLIVQHVRERFHPFNTARIVQRALQNSVLLVGHTEHLATSLPLKPGAGLLYPGQGATLISDLPSELRPSQLVILDGTWHHAKTLLRDIPPLHNLPRYQLAPTSPSRYRIRREPGATFLSTVEATVAALRVLEPDTPGLDQLLEAFNCMIERQLAHPKSQSGWRRNKRRSQVTWNIPQAFRGDLENVVVAYGETAPRKPGAGRVSQLPVYWVAQRLGTGERFARTIRPEFPWQDSFLRHLELAKEDFCSASSLDEVRASWERFRRPHDVLAVYSQSTAQLLVHLNTRERTPCLILKSIKFNPSRRYGTIEEFVMRERSLSTPDWLAGRAGRRLAYAIALVQYLNSLGNSPVLPESRWSN